MVNYKVSHMKVSHSRANENYKASHMNVSRSRANEFSQHPSIQKLYIRCPCKRRIQQNFRRNVLSFLRKPTAAKCLWWNNIMSCSNNPTQSILIQRLFPQMPHLNVLPFSLSLSSAVRDSVHHVIDNVTNSRNKCIKICRFKNAYGTNLWSTVVNGGPHARFGYSGGIYVPGRVFTKYPDVIDKIGFSLQQIFKTTFANTSWYSSYCNKMKNLFTSIHSEAYWKKLCFHGLPISGVWLSLRPILSEVPPHIDNNIIGCAFVITIDTYCHCHLITHSPMGKKFSTTIKCNKILGGSFAHSLHTVKVDSNSQLKSNRISLVMYMDRRVFTKGQYSFIFK